VSARCAICFATDAAYLLPTLVAAGQARRFASPGLAEVFVFGLGVDAAAGAAFAEAGVRLVPMAAGDAVMARLHLHRLVPAGFSELLYLDADVQVVAPLDPLLERGVPEGHLRAAPDPMALRLRAGGRDGAAMAARMAAAGIPEGQRARYFNSGVLHIARDGWDGIASVALAIAKGGAFPDQDALNIATAGRVLPLSLAWNFPVFLLNAGIDRMVAPAILHFMARPKPWDGAFPPWSEKHAAPYREAVRQYPALATPKMGAGRRLRYAMQQRVKRALEAWAWGRGTLRTAVLAAEAEAREEAAHYLRRAHIRKRKPTTTFRRCPVLIMLRGVVGEAVSDGRDRELL
jgi:lipopolysaccharide biosynthesis glycosyltransferase